ncbi:octanoyltransferase LipB [Methyloglobulus morosus KoM1]|uniref:Octanoyltransferase n=1 Tax=Methyloglobulus morosus KoM1 TaxID=1116472 RepID=V5C556_9GAMM|nr:lipoyl(octanoyl) transferase LipB [Methyloglobulus morosus]ESS71863.1 octanoyltransferase LipB [Methyloglobulus morosus KoM1]
MPTTIRELGVQPYEPIWQEMQRLTQERTDQTHDEIWVLEHLPVYTLGLNGKQEHLLNPGDIPVIQSDRGGQVTYHGPGQLIVYTLLDIKRRKLGIRQLVTLLEQSMVTALAQFGVTATANPQAPGVYVDGKKIGSIGIRIKNNASYHGISLNNNMDLTPFDHINTCGYRDLQVTQLADFGIDISTADLAIPVVNAINTSLYS